MWRTGGKREMVVEQETALHSLSGQYERCEWTELDSRTVNGDAMSATVNAVIASTHAAVGGSCAPTEWAVSEPPVGNGWMHEMLEWCAVTQQRQVDTSVAHATQPTGIAWAHALPIHNVHTKQMPRVRGHS